MRGDSGTPGLLGTLGYNSALEPVSEMCVRRGGGRGGEEKEGGREGGEREKREGARERGRERRGKGIETVAHTPTFVNTLGICCISSVLPPLELQDPSETPTGGRKGRRDR